MSKKKVLFIVLAGKESHEGLARVANALVMAKELKEAGNAVKIVFDGAGTQWVAELQKEDGKMYGLFQELTGEIVGACDFCSAAFGVKEDIKGKNVRMVSEYQGHPSFKSYVEEGYMILTF